MKVSVLIILTAFVANAFGQVTPGKQMAKVTDTSKVRVFYDKSNHSDSVSNRGNYYINKVYYGKLTPIFNPERIESVDVQKEGSKILLTLKPAYQPNFITLSQLKEKYVHSKSNKAIYILEGSLIKNHLQLIDENYVLNIKITNASNLADFQDYVNGFDVISISLKTKANLDKANTIYIRGNNEQTK